MTRRGAALVLLVAALCAAAVAWRQRSMADPHVVYDRYSLPAFDPHVYVAMTESPRVFTIAPWGYRVLSPWVASLLPFPDKAVALRRLTLISLVLTGAALFLLARRLGHAPSAAAAAAVLACLTLPVADAIRNPFLTDGLTVLLMTLFLLGVEAGAGPGVLALLLTLGVLSKEILFMLVPLVLITGTLRHGWRRGVRDTVLVTLPAALALAEIRWVWTPHVGDTTPTPGLSQILAAVQRVGQYWRDWWWPVLLGGFTPLALVGIFRRRARPFLWRYGYLLAATAALPFVVALYSGENSLYVGFLAQDVPRVLLYALPVWVPLALFGLEPLLGGGEAPPPPTPRPRLDLAAAALLGLGLVAVPLFLDDYQRVDLRGTRDGPLVLGLCRQTLRTARRVEAGEAVVLDAASQVFVWGESDPREMARLRWFLREGWGDTPQYGRGDMVTRAARAAVLVPCLQPRDLEVILRVASPHPQSLRVFLDDHPLGSIAAGPEPADLPIRIPAAVLVRGDNLLSLVGEPGLHLTRITYRPASS